MNKKLIPLAIAGTLLLAACNEQQKTAGNSTAPISKEDAIAVVNGKYISKASLKQLEDDIAQRGRGQVFPKEKLIEELIQRELLIQEAIKNKLDKTAEFSERLTTIKNSLLSQAMIQHHLKTNPVTDAELEAAYNKNIATTGTEYKARHILVKTEDEAKKIIAELDKGADFSELAKSKSTGPSGAKGGDLGWFAAGQMVAPFSEAVIALEDNKFTSTPVKTQFGYHVILREGSRSQNPPPFESVKEQILPMLQRKNMQAFMDSMRQQAKVEVLLPKPEAPAIKPAAEEKPVKKAADAISETVQSATKNAVEAVSKTVENAGTTATESVSKASESAKKAIDTLTQ